MDDIKMDVETNHRFRGPKSFDELHEFQPQNGWGNLVEGMKEDMFQPELCGAKSILDCLFW